MFARMRCVPSSVQADIVHGVLLANFDSSIREVATTRRGGSSMAGGGHQVIAHCASHL